MGCRRSSCPSSATSIFGAALFSESGAGPTPVPILAHLTAERLAEAIAYGLQQEVRERALLLGEKVRAQPGCEEAVEAFYRRLPLGNDAVQPHERAPGAALLRRLRPRILSSL